MDNQLINLEKKLNIKFLEDTESYNDEFEIIVTGDCNDGDYNTTISRLTIKEFKKAITYIKLLLENIYSHNVEDFDEIFDGLDESVEDFIEIPSSDWGLCHTINIVDIYFYSKSDKQRYIVEL